MLDLKDEIRRRPLRHLRRPSPSDRRLVPKYNLEQVVADAAQAGIYLIGRIVSFQDPIAAIRAPDMAVWDASPAGPISTTDNSFSIRPIRWPRRMPWIWRSRRVAPG